MSRRPSPLVELSDRDRALLRDVGRLRFLGGDQVARLHFDSGTAVGRQRRAQATLRRLTDDGYLDRLPRRVGGHASGSARFVYQLGYRGHREVWPDRRARTPDFSGYPFVLHALAVAEVAVELVTAERAGRCRDLNISTEPSVWRHFVGEHGQPRVLKPDLGVSLSAGGRRLVWFVEVDRGTEGLRRIHGKAGVYLDCWRTGTEQDRLGVFPRVLWSVPDEARADALGRTLTALPEPAAAMFTVETAAATTAALLGQSTSNSQQIEGGEK